MLKLLRNALTEIIVDHIPDPAYDPFASLVATVPAYVASLRELEDATPLAVDKKTQVPSISAVRKEIYTPSDAGNIASTARALEQINAIAAGMRQR